MASGQRVGYIRVSSGGQNPARQLDGVAVDRVFTDTVSGKSADRPQLQAMLAYVGCSQGKPRTRHGILGGG